MDFLKDEIDKIKEREESRLNFLETLTKMANNKIMDFRFRLKKFEHKINFELIELGPEKIEELSSNENINALLSILDQLEIAYNDIMSGDKNENENG